MSDFHEIRFPLDVALGSRGGPSRRTDVVPLASGREHRNSRFAHSRRHYDAGLGVRTLDALHAVVAFFEERRGRLHGFRFRDPVDWRSGPPSQAPAPLDQPIGTGDGARAAFPLLKTYGTGFAPYARVIAKPVAGTVRVAVAGIERFDVGCDPATGVVVYPLVVDQPAGRAQERADLAVAVAPVLAGELDEVGRQGRFVIAAPRRLAAYVERCWPSARQARRSETLRASITCSMQARRRAGLRSFPGTPPAGSACPASDRRSPS